MASKCRSIQCAAILLLSAACAMPSQTMPRSREVIAPSSPIAARAGTVGTAANDTLPPVSETSIRFAILGDTGTGERAQYDVGAQLWKSHETFPFEFVIMVGDNLYGSERPQDYARKFEVPYKPILDAKIPFYATLGNHDDTNQIYYKGFNMDGKRFYSFKKDKLGSPGVRFFALDSNYMSPDQLEWLDKELSASGSDWKIAFFHHPLYSSGGRHGSEVDLREQLEPLFLKYGLNAVFSGHEHFYERLKPQKGIYYFTAGASAKLRRGDIRRTDMTEVGFDTDNSYVLVEIAGDVMHFQALSRAGRRVDSGSYTRQFPPSSQP
ncbi:MAG TPA: metallophosphoesterase [Vicinamibacterales bacterium]|nr:metallophosphoesterase [Vicinamibacterales bacterium]